MKFSPDATPEEINTAYETMKKMDQQARDFFNIAFSPDNEMSPQEVYIKIYGHENADFDREKALAVAKHALRDRNV